MEQLLEAAFRDQQLMAYKHHGFWKCMDALREEGRPQPTLGIRPRRLEGVVTGMRFVETRLKGAYLIEPEIRADERGFFARAFCRREFLAHGLNPELVQCNLSFNPASGTLRGMHYQRAPHAEVKLVRCTAGAICDVILDLRPDSPTFAQWAAVELSAGNRRGRSTFRRGSPTGTRPSRRVRKSSTRCPLSTIREVRKAPGGDDPTFKIEWPLPVSSISAKDASYPDWGTLP